MQSPLVGFNNNVKHRGRVFHIQTEDSGIRRPHITTHLFADGGRILKTTKTSYADHLGDAQLEQVVRDLMKEQHQAMVVALRDGQFDAMLGVPPAGAPSKAAAAPDPGVVATSMAPGGAIPSPVAVQVPGVAARSLLPQGEASSASAVSSSKPHRVFGRGAAPDPFAVPPPDGAIERATIEQAVRASDQPAMPADLPSTRSRKSERPTRRSDGPRSSERGPGRRSSRPIPVLSSASSPKSGTSVFGGSEELSEKTLDEVILGFLAEELAEGDTKKS